MMQWLGGLRWNRAGNVLFVVSLDEAVVGGWESQVLGFGGRYFFVFVGMRRSLREKKLRIRL